MSKLTTRLIVFYLALLTVAIGSYFYLGFYVRVLADDYCVGGDIRLLGVYGHVHSFLNNWSGAYTKLFAWSIPPAMFGIEAYKWTPIVLFILFIGMIWWASSPIFRLMRLQRPVFLSGIFSLFFVFMFLASAPTFEIIYWLEVALTYTLPVVFFFAMMGVLLRLIIWGKFLWLANVFGALSSFVLAGMQEQIAPFQVGLWGIILLVVVMYMPPIRKKFAIVVCVSCLLGALVGFIVLLNMPGIAVRQSAVMVSQGKWTIDVFIRNLIEKFVLFLFDPIGFVYFFITLLTCAITTYWFQTGSSWEQVLPHQVVLRWRSYFFISTAIACVLFIGSFAPPLYGQQALFLRTLTIARVIQLLLASSWGIIIGISWHRPENRRVMRRWKTRISLISLTQLAILMVLSVGINLFLLPTWQAHSQAWDKRDADLRQFAASGVKKIEIPALEPRLIKLWGSDVPYGESDEDWVRACVGYYYGFTDLRVNPNLTDYKIIE